MHLVLVDWVDSYGCPAGWENLKQDGDPGPLHVRSVGWLVQDGKKSKTIVPHISDPAYPSTCPQACGRLTIPVQSILKMYKLADPRRTTKPRT
jgi:hypothetical protein